MTLHSTKNSSSIFQDGKLEPGIYKIQNILSQTFADIEEHSRRMCARPSHDLKEGNGLWEIQPLGAGYSVKRVEAGKPDQFCTLTLDGSRYGLPSVSAYPAAWRVEIVDDLKHRGFGYIRLCWESTPWSLSVSCGSKDNGAEVAVWTPERARDREANTVIMWKLIPVETAGQASPPSYEGDAVGQASTSVQRAESESDDFGTIVTEVTTVTTTTRRKYRVEDV